MEYLQKLLRDSLLGINYWKASKHVYFVKGIRHIISIKKEILIETVLTNN